MIIGGVRVSIAYSTIVVFCSYNAWNRYPINFNGVVLSTLRIAVTTTAYSEVHSGKSITFSCNVIECGNVLLIHRKYIVVQL